MQYMIDMVAFVFWFQFLVFHLFTILQDIILLGIYQPRASTIEDSGNRSKYTTRYHTAGNLPTKGEYYRGFRQPQ